MSCDITSLDAGQVPDRPFYAFITSKSELVLYPRFVLDAVQVAELLYAGEEPREAVADDASLITQAAAALIAAGECIIYNAAVTAFQDQSSCFAVPCHPRSGDPDWFRERLAYLNRRAHEALRPAVIPG